MKRTLEQALRRARALPQERQDELRDIILTMVEQDDSDLRLSDEQLREVRRRLANPGPQFAFEAVLADLEIRV